MFNFDIDSNINVYFNVAGKTKVINSDWVLLTFAQKVNLIKELL